MKTSRFLFQLATVVIVLAACQKQSAVENQFNEEALTLSSSVFNQGDSAPDAEPFLEERGLAMLDTGTDGGFIPGPTTPGGNDTGTVPQPGSGGGTTTPPSNGGTTPGTTPTPTDPGAGGSAGGGTTTPPSSGDNSGGGSTTPPGGVADNGESTAPGGNDGGAIGGGTNNGGDSGGTIPPSGGNGGSVTDNGGSTPTNPDGTGGTTPPSGGGVVDNGGSTPTDPDSSGGTTPPGGGGIADNGGSTPTNPDGGDGGAVNPGGSGGNNDGGSTTPGDVADNGGNSNGGSTTPDGGSSNGGGTTTPPGGVADNGGTTPGNGGGSSDGGGTTTPPGGVADNGGGSNGGNDGGTVNPGSGGGTNDGGNTTPPGGGDVADNDHPNEPGEGEDDGCDNNHPGQQNQNGCSCQKKPMKVVLNRVCSVRRSQSDSIFFEEAKNPILSFEAAWANKNQERKHLSRIRNLLASIGFGGVRVQSKMRQTANGKYRFLVASFDLSHVDLFKGKYTKQLELSLQALKNEFEKQWTKTLINVGVCDDRNKDGFCSDEKDKHQLAVEVPKFKSTSIPMRIDIDVWNGRNLTKSANPGLCEIQYSPLVLDLQGNGIALSGPEAGAEFDLNDTGEAVRTGWVAGRDDVLLARDLNHNGRIDSGAELFGSATRLPDGTRAANGFEALKALDSDGDGAFTPRDSAWKEVVLWVDGNRDGVTDKAELVSLDRAAITRISLDYVNMLEVDKYGNETRQRAVYQRRINGKERKLLIVDVWFTTLVGF